MIISIERHDVSDVVVAYVWTPYDAIIHFETCLVAPMWIMKMMADLFRHQDQDVTILY
jgi:hypothetical protein